MQLKGKVALVTGASSGIGKAIAVALAQKRPYVVVHYGRNKAGAQARDREKSTTTVCGSMSIKIYYSLPYT